MWNLLYVPHLARTEASNTRRCVPRAASSPLPHGADPHLASMLTMMLFFSHAFPSSAFPKTHWTSVFYFIFFGFFSVFLNPGFKKKLKRKWKKKEKVKKEKKGKKGGEKKHKCFVSWKAKPSTYTGFPRACYIAARFPKDESHVRRQRAAQGALLSKHSTVGWANPAPVVCYSAVKKCSPDCLCLIRLSCFSLYSLWL